MVGNSVVQGETVSRSRTYVGFLVVTMGMVIMQDNWLSAVISTVRPMVLKEWNITADQYSVWESAMWTLAVFIFTFNWLMDIIGRKWAIFILSACMTILSAGILWGAHSFVFYGIMCTLIYYLLMANTWAVPVSEESPPEYRGRIVLLVLAIGAIPGIFSRLTIPWVIGHWGWRGMYVPILILFVPFIIMWFWMKETQKFENLKAQRIKGVKPKVENPFRVFKTEYLRGMVMVAGTYFFWAFLYMSSLWHGYFIMKVRLWPLETWSLLVTVTSIVGLISIIGTGYLFDYVGRLKTYIGACILSFIVVSSLGFVPNVALWVFIPLYAVGSGILYNFIQVYASEMFPTEIRATGLGFANSISRLGMVLAPLLAAALIRWSPDMKGFWMIVAISPLLMLILLYFGRPVETKKEALEELEEARLTVSLEHAVVK